MQLFVELSIILTVAVVIAGIMRMFRQPLVVGHIITGILLGPYFFNVIQSSETIELFSKIGITVLLFIVGLSLSPKVIKEVGKVSLITGVGQVVFTSFFGFVISRTLGYGIVSSLYIAIALTFSSTIIILKLLSDRGDVDKLYGKISIGFLIVQDLIAVIILMTVSSAASASAGNLAYTIASTFIKAILVVGVMYIIVQWVVPKLGMFSARSQEYLFLFSIAWGMGFASLFAYLGFSIEIGALLAGFFLAITPYSTEISSRLRPLRDFFIILFFIGLGHAMIFDNTQSLLVHTGILSLFVLLGNPLIVFILINAFGYGKRTSFFAGLTVAQISEFSMILAALGYSMGHISKDVLSLVTLVGVITIAGSTYMILYSEALYKKLSGFLSLISIHKKGKSSRDNGEQYGAVLFGYNRVGRDFVQVLKKINMACLVVDYNPDAISRLKQDKVPYRYGDAQDIEFLAELPLKQAKIIVSTLPDFEANMMLVKHVREQRRKTIIITFTHFIKEALELYKSGATYVIMPHYLGAQYAVHMITRYSLDIAGFDKERDRHLRYIMRRI